MGEKMKKRLKDFFGDFKNSKRIHYIIIAICTLIVSLRLLNFCVVNTHDGDFHLLKIMETYHDLKNGKFPSLVLSKYCNDGGYAMNVFYPVFTVYIPLLFKVFTNTCENCMKIFAVVCMFFSAIAMYKLTEEIIDEKSSVYENKRIISFISAILYLIFPYKLGNIYIRFAIGEFAAAMFLPLLFLGLYNILYKDGKKHYILTIGAAGLILTHTITTIYAAIFSVIIVAINFKKLADKEILSKICINGVFIVLIGLMFLIPMLEFKTFANYTLFNKELMRTNVQYVQENTVSIKNLLSHKIEGQQVAYRIETRIGLPMAIFSLLIIVNAKKIFKQQTNIFEIFLIFALISFLVCLNTFPWIIMPEFLAVLQYPWRMLGFYILFIAPICAMSIFMIFEQFMKNEKIRNLMLIELIIVLLIYTQVVIIREYRQDENLEMYEKYSMFESIVEEKDSLSHMAINRDYLPEKSLYRQYDYIEDRDENKIVVLGDDIETPISDQEHTIEITNVQKNHLKMTFDIKKAQKGTILETPYFYYPGYEIKIRNLDIEEDEVEYFESNNGYITIELKDDIEAGSISVEYKGTKLEKIAYLISISSMITFAIYVVIYKNKSKKILRLNKSKED